MTATCSNCTSGEAGRRHSVDRGGRLLRYSRDFVSQLRGLRHWDRERHDNRPFEHRSPARPPGLGPRARAQPGGRSVPCRRRGTADDARGDDLSAARPEPTEGMACTRGEERRQGLRPSGLTPPAKGAGRGPCAGDAGRPGRVLAIIRNRGNLITSRGFAPAQFPSIAETYLVAGVTTGSRIGRKPFQGRHMRRMSSSPSGDCQVARARWA